MIRINQFVAKSTGVSRRNADELIQNGRIQVNGHKALTGQQVSNADEVTLDGSVLIEKEIKTIIFNKPVGFICSRKMQGNDPTIYELLPDEFEHLNPVGRLDKDSSGLMILSNDGDLVQRLSHPSAGKWKRYYIETNNQLSDHQLQQLNEGIELEDGLSKLKTSREGGGYLVQLQEGRNRQIRRTIEAISAKVTKLHREAIGEIQIQDLREGAWKDLEQVKSL